MYLIQSLDFLFSARTRVFPNKSDSATSPPSSSSKLERKVEKWPNVNDLEKEEEELLETFDLADTDDEYEFDEDSDGQDEKLADPIKRPLLKRVLVLDEVLGQQLNEVLGQTCEELKANLHSSNKGENSGSTSVPEAKGEIENCEEIEISPEALSSSEKYDEASSYKNEKPSTPLKKKVKTEKPILSLQDNRNEPAVNLAYDCKYSILPGIQNSELIKAQGEHLNSCENNKDCNEIQGQFNASENSKESMIVLGFGQF